MAKKMGYEKVLYYGTAGSQAATQITNFTDLDYDIGTETGETTENGDGTSSPIVTKRVTARTATITWTMLNKTTDTSLAALIAAARAGTTVALYYKDYSSGKGYDGDVILTVRNGAPLKGEQTFEFTAEPNDDDRTPQLNAS